MLLQNQLGTDFSREEGVPIIVVSQLDRAMLAVSVPSLMELRGMPSTQASEPRLSDKVREAEASESSSGLRNRSSSPFSKQGFPLRDQDATTALNTSHVNCHSASSAVSANWNVE